MPTFLDRRSFARLQFDNIAARLNEDFEPPTSSDSLTNPLASTPPVRDNWAAPPDLAVPLEAAGVLPPPATPEPITSIPAPAVAADPIPPAPVAPVLAPAPAPAPPPPPVVSTPSPSGAGRTSQFGFGLSYDEALAACGPAAAHALALRYGNNIPIAQVRQAAIDSGWTARTGMAGIESQQAMLKRLNVSTTLERSVDWNHVETEANGGNPVTVSSARVDDARPGHYWYIDKVQRSAGEATLYHVGTSGTDLKGGREWMTAAEMDARMGPIAGALYVDNPTSATPGGRTANSTAGLSGGGDQSGQVGDAGQAILRAASTTAAWLGEQGQRALQAVLITEGGLNKARGDNAASAGPLQFFGEEGGRAGQLNAFAQSKGLTLAQARTYVEQHPDEAVQWAIGTPERPGYLGAAIVAGQKLGLTGADLATYAQANGQVSVSPERAGQNWTAMFGPGGTGGPPAGANSFTSGGAATTPPPAEPDIFTRLSQSFDSAKDATGDIFSRLSKTFDQPAGMPASMQPTPSDSLTNPIRATTPTDMSVSPGPQPTVFDALGDTQLGRNLLQTNPDQADVNARFAGASALLPTSGFDAAGGSGLGAPTSGEQLDRRRTDWIAENNPMRDVPFVGGATTFAAQALTDPTNLLLAGPAAGRKVGEAASGVTREALAARQPARAKIGFALGQGPGKAGAGAAASRGDQLLDESLAMHARGAPKKPPPTLGETGQWIEKQISDDLAAINRLDPKMNTVTTRSGPTGTTTWSTPRTPGTTGPVEEAAALFKGRAGAAALRAEEDLTPVYQAVGKDTDMLDSYIKAQVDLERAAAKGGVRTASAGVKTAADAQAVLTAMEARVGPQRWAAIQKADQLRQTALDRLLEDKVASGLVSREIADMLRTLYPHYNPVKMVELAEEGLLAGTSKRLSQNSNLLKRLGVDGSELDTVSPLQTARQAIVQGDIAIRRNEAARTIAAAVVRNGLGEKVRNTTLRSGPLTDASHSGVSVKPPAGTIGTIVEKKIGDVPGHISYFEKGQRVLVSVPPDIEAAVKALDDQSGAILGAIMKLGSGLNKPLRMGATQLSTSFIPVNAVVDALSTFVKEGWSAARRIPKGYWSAATNDASKRAYVRAGGSMEGFNMTAPADTQKAIQQAGGMLVRTRGDWVRILADNALPMTAGGISGNASTPEGASPLERAGRIAGGIALGSQVRRAGSIVEMGPRLATFESRLAKGQTAGQAALAGRRVTLDFARHGSAIKVANSWVAFLNAATQGTLTVGRTFRDSPSARIRLGALTALGASTYAINRNFPEEYADIPDYIKDQYVVIILGNGEKNADGLGFKTIPYIALPLRQLGFPMAALNKTMAQLDSKDTRAWPDFLLDQARTFTPISGDTPGSGVAGLLPAPLKYVIEDRANTKFYSGAPIVSQKFEGTDKTEQYDERTGGLAKAVAQKMGWSPKGLETLLSENIGGLGRQLAGQAVGPTSGILRGQGGQTEQRLYERYDQEVRARDQALGDLVRASPEYQKATRDVQINLIQTAQQALRDSVKEQLGIPKNQDDRGLPQKYSGVSDPKQVAVIDKAVSVYTAWRENSRTNPRPTPEQVVMANRYAGRETRAYEKATKGQTEDYKTTRRLIDRLPAIAGR